MRSIELLGWAFIFVIGCGTSDSTAGAGGGAPLKRGECPGKPEKLAVNPVAPFWNGLIALTFTSTGKGTPTYNDIQVYDPLLGAYAQNGGSAYQKPDGTFLALVSPQAKEDSKDLDFKVRVRSELDGCAPSDWVESPTFKLGDPLVGTTWKATLGPAEYTENVTVSGPGAQTTVGPYFIDPSGVVDTLAFASDGSFTDTVAFGIASGHAGDLYAGCQFQLHTQGHWEVKFLQYGMVTVLSDRKLTASPLSGSACANPSLSQMAINQAGFDANLQPVVMGFGIDYTSLLYSPPGAVKWTDAALLSQLGNVFPFLDASGVNGSSSVNGYFSASQSHYEKQ